MYTGTLHIGLSSVNRQFTDQQWLVSVEDSRNITILGRRYGCWGCFISGTYIRFRVSIFGERLHEVKL